MSAAEEFYSEEMTEAEAAKRLRISRSTLMRDRLAGKARPIIYGKRTIRYTLAILEEYRETCRTSLDKSATSGSPSGPALSNGAAPGMTGALDRHDAHRLAQATFRRPKSLSPSGSSSTQN
jgi:hypothetical protein